MGGYLFPPFQLGRTLVNSSYVLLRVGRVTCYLRNFFVGRARYGDNRHARFRVNGYQLFGDFNQRPGYGRGLFRRVLYR